jgi:hypothetical protein
MAQLSQVRDGSAEIGRWEAGVRGISPFVQIDWINCLFFVRSQHEVRRINSHKNLEQVLKLLYYFIYFINKLNS